MYKIPQGAHLNQRDWLYIYIYIYIYISHLDSSSTPGVFYTYFYNHAHRLRLEKLLCLGLSRSPNGVFLSTSGSRWRFQFWNRYTAVSEVKRPLRNRFGSETVINLPRLYVTAISITTPVVSALKNYYILNHFWIQVAVSELKRPLRNRFWRETVKKL
jgi:hypothetical protein